MVKYSIYSEKFVTVQMHRTVTLRACDPALFSATRAGCKVIHALRSVVRETDWELQMHFREVYNEAMD